jgi:pimeloyl-ACP methyl ester carboxylesterase
VHSGQPGSLDTAGITIAYETFGRPSDPAIVLVMGLGMQLLAWPAQFCAELAAEGFFVVRFDNRDVGRSTHLSALSPPSLLAVLRRRPPPYRIQDLADDTIGLIQGLELCDVHLVGMSMGGFIAQTVAIRRPAWLRSLTLIMTSTGARRVGRTRLSLLPLVLHRAAVDRAGAVAASVQTLRRLSSPAYPFEEDAVRQVIEDSYDRGYDRSGQRRQLAAVVAQPDRTAELARIGVPTLVIHGDADPMVSVSGGAALAAAIPDATLIRFPGMAHDLPRPLWPRLTAEIVALARRAPVVP